MAAESEGALMDACEDARESIHEDLIEFAFCPSFFTPPSGGARLGDLADLAAPENWGQGNAVLANYLRYLFKKIASEYNEHNAADQGAARDRILYLREDCACFNTGLYTERYEDIYCLFEPNQREDRQPWYLAGFYKKSSPRLEAVDVLPERARFFDDPANLIYDYRLEIRPNIDHILGDERNLERIPEELRKPECRLLLRRAFVGAVAEAEQRVAANYMLAVPQYFNGHIQLLLPLSLIGEEPELALALQREDGYYSARTCLTLEMAYNNARLIARPEASWVLPA